MFPQTHRIGTRASLIVIAGLMLAWSAGAQPVALGAGYEISRTVDAAPGQVITLFLRIPEKALAEPVVAAPPLPNGLAGFSVVLRQTFAEARNVPILSVVDSPSCSSFLPSPCEILTLVSVQIPFELTPNVPRTTGPMNFARLEITYNDAPAGSLLLNPVPDRNHVHNTCEVAANLPPGECLPVIRRANGSLVSAGNRAQPGEELTIALVGLGWTTPAIAAGIAGPSPAPAAQGVLIRLETRDNAAPEMPAPDTAAEANARLASGAVGIYEVKLTVPALPLGSSPCSSSVRSNFTFSIGRATSFDGAGLCVEISAQ
jgi:uncharacterized protein (TIGR03437 family)